MDFEQIMIRLGLDAKAVTSGLTRVSSFVKGWATSMVSELKTGLGGLLGAGFIAHKLEEVFHAAFDKALLIRRLEKESGVSGNMVQSMMQRLGETGEGFEALTKPLGKFTVLIGQAKDGIPAAREKLIQFGLATKDTNWATLNATIGIKNLAAAYDKLGSAEQKAALLAAVFGQKGGLQMTPIFEEGAKAVADMDRANPFTKLTTSSLNVAAELKSTWAKTWNGILATTGNALAVSKRLEDARLVPTPARIKRAFDAFAGILGIETESAKLEAEKNAKLEEQGELLKGNLKIVEAMNEQHKLENELEDRTKTTVGQLADRYEQLRGRGAPRGLRSIYSVTPAMASAHQIRNLELDAQAANARGDFAGAARNQSAADDLRKNNQSLRSTDRDPTREIREHLDIINETLSRAGIKVKEMPQAH